MLVLECSVYYFLGLCPHRWLAFRGHPLRYLLVTYLLQRRHPYQSLVLLGLWYPDFDLLDYLQWVLLDFFLLPLMVPLHHQCSHLLLPSSTQYPRGILDIRHLSYNMLQ